MARTCAHLTIVNDARQLRRELAMLDERESREIAARMDRDEPVIWAETVIEGDTVTVTPRMCWG
jgi:hypothetical protein